MSKRSYSSRAEKKYAGLLRRNHRVGRNYLISNNKISSGSGQNHKPNGFVRSRRLIKLKALPSGNLELNFSREEVEISVEEPDRDVYGEQSCQLTQSTPRNLDLNISPPREADPTPLVEGEDPAEAVARAEEERWRFVAGLHRYNRMSHLRKLFFFSMKALIKEDWGSKSILCSR